MNISKNYLKQLNHIWVNSAKMGIFKHSCRFWSLLWGAKNHTSKNNLNLKNFSELLSTLTRVNGENFKFEIIFLNILK